MAFDWTFGFGDLVKRGNQAVKSVKPTYTGNSGGGTGWAGSGVTSTNVGSNNVQKTAQSSPQQTSAQTNTTDNTNYSNNTQNSTGGSNYDAAAAQAAAEKAAQEAADNAKRAELRGGIRNLISSITGVYDLLHGDINKAADEQRQGLQDKYNKETGALANQFEQEMPAIGRGWAARGAYHSSYRQNSEKNATDAYGRQIEGLGAEKIASEGKIGQWAQQQRAAIDNERGGINAIGTQIDGEQDINQLTQLRNQIDQKIRDNQAKRADYTTQGAARQALVAQAPTTDNSGALGKVLGQIIQGEAPKALKIATAQQIIGSSGLTEEEKARLNQQVATQIQG